MTDQVGHFNEDFAVEAEAGKNGVAPLRPVAAVWKGSYVSPSTVETKGKAGKLVQSNDEWLAGISMEEVKKHDNEKSCCSTFGVPAKTLFLPPLVIFWGNFTSKPTS